MPEVLVACLKRSGKLVLDVAGGYGRYALPLARAGRHVRIVDLHDESLAEAVRRAASIDVSDAVTTHRLDVRAGQVGARGSYDSAICIGFLHHLEPADGQQVVRAMADAVRDEGHLVFEFSTEKRRRLPDGTPILVGGASEHSLALPEGLEVVRHWLRAQCFTQSEVEVCSLSIRDPDFHYDAEVVIATASVRADSV